MNPHRCEPPADDVARQANIQEARDKEVGGDDAGGLGRATFEEVNRHM
jgi:hypothetical protein